MYHNHHITSNHSYYVLSPTIVILCIIDVTTITTTCIVSRSTIYQLLLAIDEAAQLREVGSFILVVVKVMMVEAIAKL